jgi:hypothetical protein
MERFEWLCAQAARQGKARVRWERAVRSDCQMRCAACGRLPSAATSQLSQHVGALPAEHHPAAPPLHPAVLILEVWWAISSQAALFSGSCGDRSAFRVMTDNCNGAITWKRHQNENCCPTSALVAVALALCYNATERKTPVGSNQTLGNGEGVTGVL